MVRCFVGFGNALHGVGIGDGWIGVVLEPHLSSILLGGYADMMKRLLTIGCVTLLLATLIGCGPSALQIQAEIAYYEAIASIQKNQAAKPLVRIVPSDPTKAMMMDNVGAIEVYQQVADKSIVQYQQRDYSEPAWRFLTAATGIIAPWVGVGVLAHEFGQMNNGTTYNYHNEVGAGATGQFRVVGNTSATGGPATGISDATSTPTVVNPVIMEPSVHIVPQPEPIIVQPTK